MKPICGRQEWKDLPDLQWVATAQAEGWEIEVCVDRTLWLHWDGEFWLDRNQYRGRPKQPKKTTVTSECWRWKTGGDLSWNTPNAERPSEGWQRFPAGDITGEVEE